MRLPCFRSNTVIKDPSTPCVCRYSTLWSVGVLKATIENIDDCNNTFYKCVFKSGSLMTVLLQMLSALLKCVLTEVVLFSIVAFKTPTLHKVVYRHTQGVVASLMTVLLQMLSWFWKWNKF